MPEFFHKVHRVHAVRVGPDCRAIVDGRAVLANPGTWVVTDGRHVRQCLSHDDFMAEYEPADDMAREYLAEVTAPPAARNR